jgi:DNA/RNA-binding domain of Phe-tRNA-synthetase-like protein
VAALVEAMFMAELANQLLTAGHDVSALDLPVTVDVATGDERYVTLSGKDQALAPGDMYIRDGVGPISSVIYGPDRRTPIRPTTTSVLFTVYAPPGIGPSLVSSHLDDIRANVLLVSPAASVELCLIHEAGG